MYVMCEHKYIIVGSAASVGRSPSKINCCNLKNVENILAHTGSGSKNFRHEKRGQSHTQADLGGMI